MTKGTLVKKARQLMKNRLHMPEATSGDLRIVHRVTPKGKTLPIVTLRNAIFTGMPQCNLKVHEDTVVQWLTSGENGDWMSDMPCELFQMEHELARHATGNVLIGGLGLGVLANMVAARPGVTSVTVVEKSADVIKLVSPYLPANVTVIEDDIHEYLTSLSTSDQVDLCFFDSALLDTWQATGEWVWQTEVVPMRRIIGTQIKKVHCWQDQVMINQVYGALFRAVDTDESLLCSRGTCHYYAFRCGARDLGLRGRPRIANQNATSGLDEFAKSIEIAEENRKSLPLQSAIRRFLLEVGTPYWEETYGKHWDVAFAVDAAERRRRKENNQGAA